MIGLSLLLVAGPVVAQPVAPAPPGPAGPSVPANRIVALAPLTNSAGDTDAKSAKALAAIGRDLEAALTAQAKVTVIGAAFTADTIKKAKRADLRVCEGDPGCVADLGGLVKADWVVSADVGGFGDATIVYLQLVDVSKRSVIRSTSWQQGGASTPEGGARGAMVRLLAPEQYQGTLTLNVDVRGAQIFLNGKLVGTSPASALTLPVGTHAVRVTHPEFRDYVRFAEIDFGQATALDVGLQQFPIVQSEVGSTETPLGPLVVRQVPPPFYKRWWFVATVGVVAVGGAIAIGAATAPGVDADWQRQ